MAMHPQSPQAVAPVALAMEPNTVVPVEAAATAEPPVAAADQQAVREQDRLMPIANVVRVMRRVLPPHAKISDDAKDVIQECVSEFISFVTGEANERCHAEHRKTVTAEDIVWAMERLGFDDYVAPLGAFLRRMRDLDGTGGRGSGRGQPRAPHHAPAPPASMAAFAHVVHAPAQPVAAFTNAALAPQAYAVPLQVPFGAAAHFVAQRNVLGGERSISMAAYHGGAAFVTRGNHGSGGYANEASSSSNEELPAAATTPRPQYPN